MVKIVKILLFIKLTLSSDITQYLNQIEINYNDFTMEDQSVTYHDDLQLPILNDSLNSETNCNPEKLDICLGISSNQNDNVMDFINKYLIDPFENNTCFDELHLDQNVKTNEKQVFESNHNQSQPSDLETINSSESNITEVGNSHHLYQNVIYDDKLNVLCVNHNLAKVPTHTYTFGNNTEIKDCSNPSNNELNFSFNQCTESEKFNRACEINNSSEHIQSVEDKEINLEIHDSLASSIICDNTGTQQNNINLGSSSKSITIADINYDNNIASKINNNNFLSRTINKVDLVNSQPNTEKKERCLEDFRKRKSIASYETYSKKIAKFNIENDQLSFACVGNTIYYTSKKDNSMGYQEATCKDKLGFERSKRRKIIFADKLIKIVTLEELLEEIFPSIRQLSNLMEENVDHEVLFPNKGSEIQQYSQGSCSFSHEEKEKIEENNLLNKPDRLLVKDINMEIHLRDLINSENKNSENPINIYTYSGIIAKLENYKEVDIDILNFMPSFYDKNNTKINLCKVPFKCEVNGEQHKKIIESIYHFYCGDESYGGGGCIILYEKLRKISDFYELPLFLDLIFCDKFENISASFVDETVKMLQSFLKISKIFFESENVNLKLQLNFILNSRLHILRYLQLIHMKCTIFAIYSFVMAQISRARTLLCASRSDNILLYFAFFAQHSAHEDFKRFYFCYYNEFMLMFAFQKLNNPKKKFEVNLRYFFNPSSFKNDFITNFDDYITRIFLNCRINSNEYQQTNFICFFTDKLILYRGALGAVNNFYYTRINFQDFVYECIKCYSKTIEYVYETRNCDD